MIHRYPYDESLVTALANFIVEAINKKLTTQSRFTIALSGGNTPKSLYSKLACPAWASAIPWEKVHVFWGDERYVPFSDDRNNASMAAKTLLNKVNIPPGNIHPMRTDIGIRESVKDYESLLHSFFSNQVSFDMVLLGLGEDGHTLSLFPGSEVLNNDQSWVSAVEDDEPKRITLMPSLVNLSSNIVFIVTGKNKAEIFNEVTDKQDGKITYPAQLIKPMAGEIHWFVNVG